VSSDNSEHLDVSGIGSTRDLALERADKQARQYFDLDHIDRLERLIGRAQAMTTAFDGTVQVWSINVEYRRP